MAAWATTVVACLMLAGVTYLAREGMSDSARQIAIVVTAVTVILALVAVAAFRNSAGGHAKYVWAAIPIYGLVAVGLIRIGDGMRRRRRNDG